MPSRTALSVGSVRFGLVTLLVLLAPFPPVRGGQPAGHPSGTSADIQKAIDALPPEGGTVHLKAGVYTISHYIHVDRSNVTLQGENGVVLRLAPKVNQPVLVIGPVTQDPKHHISNITIANIEVDGNKASQDPPVADLAPGIDGIRINGIDVRQVENLSIANVNVHDARSGGIVFQGQCRRIFLTRSYFHDNNFDGIALYRSKDVLISDFMTYRNGASGLSADSGTTQVVLNGGLVQANVQNGIFLRDCTNFEFFDLLVQSNQGYGCFMSHHQGSTTGTGVKSIFFNGCSFLDNGKWGLYLSSTSAESSNNAVVACRFLGNAQGAIKTADSAALRQAANIME